MNHGACKCEACAGNESCTDTRFAVRELAPKHCNIEADVYDECRDIDGCEVSGDGSMAYYKTGGKKWNE